MATIAGQAECMACCEPATEFALGHCGHAVTCLRCALRLRVLLRHNWCSVCKAKLGKVYIVPSPIRSYESYEEENRRSSREDASAARMVEDLEFGIVYGSREIADRARVLVDVHCPICVQRCKGDSERLRELTPLRNMANLRRHLQDAHGGRKLCDVCVACRKVFACEQRTYTADELRRHNREGDPGMDGIPPIPPHPYCDLCRKGFLAPDDLYAHLEREHVLCRVCFSTDRDRGVAERNATGTSDDPDSAVESACLRKYLAHRGVLRVHEDTAHFPCPDPTCRAQGMVFAHRMDRDGHVATVHRGGLQLDGRPLPGLESTVASQQRAAKGKRGRAVPLPMDSFFAGAAGAGGGGGGGGGGAGEAGRRNQRPPPACFVFDPVTGYGRLERWNSRESSRQRRREEQEAEKEQQQEEDRERQSEEDTIMRRSAEEAAFAIDSVQKDVAAAGGGRAEAAVKRRLNGRLTDQLARFCEEAAKKPQSQPGPPEAADSIQRRILEWSSSFHRESLSAAEYHRLLQSELGSDACWALVPLLAALHPNPTARSQLRNVFIDAARMRAVREFHQRRGRQALDRTETGKATNSSRGKKQRSEPKRRPPKHDHAPPAAAATGGGGGTSATRESSSSFPLPSSAAASGGRGVATPSTLPSASQPSATASSSFPTPAAATAATAPAPTAAPVAASAPAAPVSAEDQESLAWAMVCLQKARTFLEVRATPLLTSRRVGPQELRLTPYENDALLRSVAAEGDQKFCVLPLPEFGAANEALSEAAVRENLSWLEPFRCIPSDSLDLIAKVLVHFHAAILRHGTTTARPSKRGKAKGKAERALAQAADECRPRSLFRARVLCDCLLGEVQARLGSDSESLVARIESLLGTNETSRASDASTAEKTDLHSTGQLTAQPPAGDEDTGWRADAKTTSSNETRSIRAPRVVRKATRQPKVPVRARAPPASPAAAPSPPPQLWFDSQRQVAPPPGLGGPLGGEAGERNGGHPRPAGAWAARGGAVPVGTADQSSGKGKKKKKKTKGADKRGIRLL